MAQYVQRLLRLGNLIGRSGFDPEFRQTWSKDRNRSLDDHHRLAMDTPRRSAGTGAFAAIRRRGVDFRNLTRVDDTASRPDALHPSDPTLLRGVMVYAGRRTPASTARFHRGNSEPCPGQ